MLTSPKEFFIDPSRCIGCQACVQACSGIAREARASARDVRFWIRMAARDARYGHVHAPPSHAGNLHPRTAMPSGADYLFSTEGALSQPATRLFLWLVGAALVATFALGAGVFTARRFRTDASGLAVISGNYLFRGVEAAAAPVFNFKNELTMALVIVGVEGSIDMGEQSTVLARLKGAADALSLRLGSTRDSDAAAPSLA